MTLHNPQHRDEFEPPASIPAAVNRDDDLMSQPPDNGVTMNQWFDQMLVASDAGDQLNVDEILILEGDKQRLGRLMRQFYGIADEVADSHVKLFFAKRNS